MDAWVHGHICNATQHNATQRDAVLAVYNHSSLIGMVTDEEERIGGEMREERGEKGE